MFIMWVIHIICFLFFIPALIFTIPMHLVLTAIIENGPTKKERQDRRREEEKESREALGPAMKTFVIICIIAFFYFIYG